MPVVRMLQTRVFLIHGCSGSQVSIRPGNRPVCLFGSHKETPAISALVFSMLLLLLCPRLDPTARRCTLVFVFTPLVGGFVPFITLKGLFPAHFPVSLNRLLGSREGIDRHDPLLPLSQG